MVQPSWAAHIDREIAAERNESKGERVKIPPEPEPAATADAALIERLTIRIREITIQVSPN